MPLKQMMGARDVVLGSEKYSDASKGALSARPMKLQAYLHGLEAMKAYCINLDRRPDRREYAWSQFDRFGLNVERVSAVDGSLPEIAAKVASMPPGMPGRQFGTGAYACFASHRLCWRKLLESGDPHCLVLEDDLILADGITTCFNDGWFPPGIDIARLETYYRRVHVGRKKIVVGPNRHLSRLCSTFYGSGCYAISQNAASRLLDLTENFVDAVDVVLFDLAHPIASKLLVYQMNPAPAIQGHLARHHEVSGTWVQSSIGLRGAQPNSKVLSQTFTFQRVARRFNEEVRALVGGTRYVLVAHG